MLTQEQFITKYPALSRLCCDRSSLDSEWFDHQLAPQAEILAQKIPAERVEEFFLESEDPQVAVLAPTVGLTEDELNLILNVCENLSGK